MYVLLIESVVDGDLLRDDWLLHPVIWLFDECCCYSWLDCYLDPFEGFCYMVCSNILLGSANLDLGQAVAPSFIGSRSSLSRHLHDREQSGLAFAARSLAHSISGYRSGRQWWLPSCDDEWTAPIASCWCLHALGCVNVCFGAPSIYPEYCLPTDSCGKSLATSEIPMSSSSLFININTSNLWQRTWAIDRGLAASWCLNTRWSHVGLHPNVCWWRCLEMVRPAQWPIDQAYTCSRSIRPAHGFQKQWLRGEDLHSIAPGRQIFQPFCRS